MKQLKAKIFRDWSKGVWNSIQNTLAPENSSRLAINLDSDVILGSLITRLGTYQIGNQLVDGKPVLGMHNYRSSLGGVDRLFVAISDGTNVDIYDALTGAKTLEDDKASTSPSLSPSVSPSVGP